MTRLSTAAWMAHDLGLATTIGGTLFGRRALEPALRETHEVGGERISEAAWRRFSWINLIAHGVVAVTWFAGRTMLSGRSVSRRARSIARIKDGLVLASLATGIASIVIGRTLGKRIREGTRGDTHRLERAVGIVGATNLLANAGAGALTTALAVEGQRSLPFSLVSRYLP